MDNNSDHNHVLVRPYQLVKVTTGATKMIFGWNMSQMQAQSQNGPAKLSRDKHLDHVTHADPIKRSVVLQFRELTIFYDLPLSNILLNVKLWLLLKIV